MAYALDYFTLDPDRETYPNGLFKLIYVKNRYPQLMKNPDVKALAERMKKEYENRYNVSTSGLPDYLFDYQKQDLAFALKLKRAAIFWEQGMGKTVLGVEFAKRSPKPVLVVTKLRIIPNWEEHFSLYAPELSVHTIKEKSFPLNKDVYLVNYEKLHYIDFKPATLIIDESHSVKSLSAKRTKACTNLARYAKNVLLLSGTPVTRTPEDIYSQMRILWPLMFINKQEFNKEFVVLDRTETFPVGYRNLDKLTRRILAVSVIRRKTDHLKLPEKIEEFEYVDLTDEQWEAAEALQEGFEWNGITVENYLSLYQKLHQISAGFVYDNEGNPVYLKSAKTEVLRELLEGLDEQAIIWYLFRAEKKILEDLVKELGKSYSTEDNIDDFKTGKTQILLANPLSLSEGVNLQNCSLAFYHSLPWSYKDYAQSIDRMHRPGQKNTVRLVFLIARDFLDVEILKALRRKHDYTPARQKEKIEQKAG